MSMRKSLNWIGSNEHFIDHPSSISLNHVTIGRYGGNSEAGQTKNEDGCLVWVDPEEDWEFVMLLDAHHSAESAELVLKEISSHKNTFSDLLSSKLTNYTFIQLEEEVLSVFSTEQFLSECQKVRGETACLIAVRKNQYIWWFSVGDCLLYLFHEELLQLGQYQLNQRQFYEWIGKANTFDQTVLCYSTGRRELRTGKNRIFMTTDGLIECPGEPYAKPSYICESFADADDQSIVNLMLERLKSHSVKDSTTLITWEVENKQQAAWPDEAKNKSGRT